MPHAGPPTWNVPAPVLSNGSSRHREAHERYTSPMRLAIELPPPEAARLEAEAERAGMSPEDWARRALTDLLAASGMRFEEAVAHVIAKNRELYKRLS